MNAGGGTYSGGKTYSYSLPLGCGNWIYKFEFRDAKTKASRAGCEYTFTVAPSAQISANGSTTICQGSSVQLSAAANGCSVSYQWKNNGNIISGATASTYAATLAGTYTVVVTGPGACSTTSNPITVTVSPSVSPSISITASQGTMLSCSGTTVTFTATIANGGTGPIYQWKKNGVNVGTNSATYTTSVLSNGDQITCQLTSNAACATNPTLSPPLTITVMPDQAPPTISCPATITTNAGPGGCTANVSYTAPIGADNCPNPTTTRIAGPASGSAFPVGTTVVTYRVTDGSGNTATCSFNVIVSDAQLPTISCPPNLSNNTSNGNCWRIMTFNAPSGTDNCSGATTTQITGLPTTASFPVGVTVNTYQVTDASGNTATCSFTVTITDGQLPTITCPASLGVSAGVGVCSAVVPYVTPLGTDNCPGATTTLSGGLPSNSTFPVGTTTNTFRTTDASGNSTTCTFTVTVTDNQVPTITCPASLGVSAGVGVCSAVVPYVAPVGTDNCPGATTTLIAGLPSNSTFPVGASLNTFRVTDAFGNSSTCTFSVTVTDNQLPSINCPANISVSTTGCSAVVAYTAPTGTDNCTGAMTSQTMGLPSNSTFPAGNTVNTFRVTDASGNTATCSFTVTVLDNQLPMITCPASQGVSAGLGVCGAVVSYLAPVGTDNCAGATTVLVAGLASGATFPVGVTTNVHRVTDAAGNSATCAFAVTVSDNEAPTITCGASLGVGTDVGVCGAVVSYLLPVGADNCPGYTILQTGGLASGGLFPVGTTSNVFRVTDASGNSATCSFTVTVSDNELPTITCPASLSVSASVNVCSAVVTFAGPVGTDNCPGATTIQTAGLASGATFPLGITTNTFTVTDAFGNLVSCAFSVNVIDNEQPLITCPPNITGNNDPGQCSQVVSYVAPMGSDNCAGPTTVQLSGLASGVAFPVGLTTNVFQVSDVAGNSATCAFNVTVTDTEAPTINCPANVNVSNDANLCSAVVSYVAPVGADNCPGQSSILVSGLASGMSFPVGTTVNTFQTTDASGNSATCTFSITVSDTESPIVNCPPNIALNNDPGLCSSIATYTAPSGADNCSVQSTAQIAGLAFGSAFPVGSTVNTFSVADAAGNSGSCSFTVIVVDNQDPIAVCQAVTITLDAQGNGSTTASAVDNGSHDNCSLASMGVSQTNFSCVDIGVHPITLTATDPSGNTGTCSTTVTVNPYFVAGVMIAASPGTTICAGTIVTFTASNTQAIPSPTYQWFLNGNPVGTNSPTYISSVPLSDGDVITCTISSSSNCVAGSPASSNALTMAITTLPAPVAIGIPNTCVPSGQGSTYCFISNSLNATSVSWDFGDSTAHSSLQNPCHTYANIGAYIVSLTAYSYCGTVIDSNSAQFSVTVPCIVGIGDSLTTAAQLSLFPNPTTGEVRVLCDCKMDAIEVYDGLGQLVFKTLAPLKRDEEVRIDLSGRAAGIYFAKVKVKDEVFVKKIFRRD